ncbi:GNAT family N-acetyltransferase [Proteiniclasticum sp. C24MP]|uniref:GNAT family N-acetyltransferase n=1 Tax=Proteiniclasticum sp. C24MP TaxID=3374101 RepID=UPI003754517A
MMTWTLEKYNKDHSPAIKNLIREDEFVRRDILGCLEEFPEYAMIVRSDGFIAAICVYTGISEKTSFTLYVHPDYRSQGIGSLLLSSLEKEMAEKGVKEIVCDYKVDDSIRGFLSRKGYEKWFRSRHMIFSGTLLSPQNPSVSAYVDSDYLHVQKIFSESFHRMRLHVGISSTLSAPSEEERSYFLKHAEDIFVLRDNSEIVAVAMVEGNEIDKIAVAVDEQGKGYGKTLLAYTVGTLLHRGFSEVTLWVVDGNPARMLYEHFGFRMHRLHEFVQKKL